MNDERAAEFERLSAALASSSPEKRREAAEALGRGGFVRAIPALERLLRSEPETVETVVTVETEEPNVPSTLDIQLSLWAAAHGDTHREWHEETRRAANPVRAAAEAALARLRSRGAKDE